MPRGFLSLYEVLVIEHGRECADALQAEADRCWDEVKDQPRPWAR